MNKIYDHISNLRNINNNNKLVIFVGAGVSINSGLPSWKDLIKTIAAKINYKEKPETECDPCDFSNHRDCQNCSSLKKYENVNFSSDEYLKLPQYLYNKDKKEYFRVLEQFFGRQVFDRTAHNPITSNEIDQMILELLPNHIITTNYDPLIEQASSTNTDFYHIISSDADMLKSGNSYDKYIIKMHGDYTYIENEYDGGIVLKEDDYLRYEQNHSLMSAFIKSLLVTHTFLFVGYSLNDYNFKQIIDWVEYLAENTNVEKQDITKHYIVDTEDADPTDYTEMYLNSKHIEIISAKDLGQEWIDKVNQGTSLSDIHGKRLYATLKAISDDSSDMMMLGSFESVLLERYKVFDEVNYIPYEDFLNSYKWEHVVCETVILKDNETEDWDFTHLQLYFWGSGTDDNTLFERFKIIAENKDICKYFAKTDIRYVVRYNSGPREDRINLDISFSDAYSKSEIEAFELFELYLLNDYNSLWKKVETNTDERVKAYWSFTLNRIRTNDDVITDLRTNAVDSFRKLSSENEQGNSADFWKLVDMTNYYLALIAINPHKFSDETEETLKLVENTYNQFDKSHKISLKYLYSLLFQNKYELLLLECMENMEKVLSDYDNLRIFKSDPWDKLKKVFKPIFCYYKFIKSNYLILDSFEDTERLFWAFSRAILYSYKDRSSIKPGLFFSSEFPKCNIDSISFDIITKHAQYKDLSKFIQQYRLTGFVYTFENDIALKFENISKNFIAYSLPNSIPFNQDVYNNFCLLLRNSLLTDIHKKNISSSLKKLIESKKNPGKSVSPFINCLCNARLKDSLNETTLLIAILSGVDNQLPKVYLNAIESFPQYINEAFSLYVHTDNYETKKFITEGCDKVADDISADELYNLCALGIVDLNSSRIAKMKDFAIKNISCNGRNDLDGGRTGSDIIQNHNSNLVLLWLYLNGHIELSEISRCADLSDYVKYICDNDTPDINKIDTTNSLWLMILNNEKQRRKILDNNLLRQQFTATLKEKLVNQTATDNEKRILWKYFDER
jgi:NAD-dependent SIR2 family protein deacetylase